MKPKKKVIIAARQPKARATIVRNPRSSRAVREKMSRQNLVDLSIRFALAVTLAFSAGVYIKKAFADLLTIDISHIDTAVLGRGLSVLAISLYIFTIACLYVLRLKAAKTTLGIIPRMAAIVGAFLMSAVLWAVPQPDLPLGARVLACVLVIAGNVFTVMVLLRLGRSFSILPESRKLVTTGPYHVVRHPLYLAEAVAMLGTLINFISPLAILIVGLQVILCSLCVFITKNA